MYSTPATRHIYHKPALSATKLRRVFHGKKCMEKTFFYFLLRNIIIQFHPIFNANKPINQISLSLTELYTLKNLVESYIW